MSEPTVADLASHIREVTAVRPGDVLVMKMHPAMQLNEVHAQANRLRDAMPEIRVLIVDSSVELHVLRTGEQP